MTPQAPRPIKLITNAKIMQALVGFLYSDTARDMTGQVNAVDSGLVL